METYWSRFSEDFSARETLVVGEELINAVKKKIEMSHELGNVIEFGCGTGLFTRVIAGNAASVLATDYSAEMAGQARMIFHDHPNIRQPDPVDYFLTPNRMNMGRKFLGNEDFGAKAIIIGVR